MLKVLDEVSKVQETCPESVAFAKTVRDIRMFSQKANQTLDTLVKTDANWFTNAFFRML